MFGLQVPRRRAFMFGVVVALIILRIGMMIMGGVTIKTTTTGHGGGVAIDPVPIEIETISTKEENPAVTASNKMKDNDTTTNEMIKMMKNQYQNNNNNNTLSTPRRSSSSSSSTRQRTTTTTTTTTSSTTSRIQINRTDSSKIQNLHLAFIGDSITRYQYMSLLTYIEFGSYITSSSSSSSSSSLPNKPSLVWKFDFPSWNSYYEYAQHKFHGKEQCNCYRNDKNGTIRSKINEYTVENRYYYDNQRNISISFISKFGRWSSHGHWNTSQIFLDNNRSSRRDGHNDGDDNDVHDGRGVVVGHPQQQQQQQQQHEQQVAHIAGPSNLLLLRFPPSDITESEIIQLEWSWNGNWSDTIQYHLAQLQPKPNFIIFNEGLWKKHSLRSEFIFHKIRNVLDQYNIIGIYKTTTRQVDQLGSGGGKMSQHDQWGCQILHACLDLSWTGTLSHEKDFLDNKHFTPEINQRFNDELLQLILSIL